jgi:hypothetical protein
MVVSSEGGSQQDFQEAQGLLKSGSPFHLREEKSGRQSDWDWQRAARRSQS